MNEKTTEIKARLTIFDVSKRLDIGLRGQNGIYHSPFRDDKKPSFSISKDGKFFNDFATGDKGDIFTFYRIATGADFKTTFNRLADFAGIKKTDYPRFLRRQRLRSTKEVIDSISLKPKIPHLTWNEAYARKLEALRGYSLEAQEIAFKRCVFGFCEYRGLPAWIVTDGAGRTAQARRVDGLKWADSNVGHKAETLKNSNCSIPAGLEAIKDFKIVAICEGSSDFLASFHFAYINDCENEIAPLAILGATQDISLRALNALKDKLVIVFSRCRRSRQESFETMGR